MNKTIASGEKRLKTVLDANKGSVGKGSSTKADTEKIRSLMLAMA